MLLYYQKPIAMAKKKIKKGAKCRSAICNGCSACQEKATDKGLKLIPEEMEINYKKMNQIDPRLVRADMSVMFLNPGPQALTALVGAGDWLQRGLKDGTGIKSEVADFLNPMPLARMATPGQLWDPSPARGHPRQVRSTALSAASRGQVVLSNFRLKGTADGSAKVKATLAITGPLCRCVEQLFSDDRDFEFLEQLTILNIAGPFDNGSLKLWASVHLQGIQFNLEASPLDLWLLEGSQYLRILFGWRSMVWTPVDLYERQKEMPSTLPNCTAEQILIYLTQKALLDDENQEVQQQKEDEKEPSGDELEEDSEEEIFQWKTVPWSVRKKRKIRKDNSSESWSYSPLPPALKLDSLLEVGAAHQNLKLKVTEKAKAALKAAANASNNNNSGMSSKNPSKMEVDAEEQQKTIIQAHNLKPKPMAADSPSMPTPKLKNPERSTVKRLCTIAEHGDCPGYGDKHKKAVFATSTPSVASTVEKSATAGESSYCPPRYKPAVDAIFPRATVGKIKEEKLDDVDELTAIFPTKLALKTSSSELPARWSGLSSSANYNQRGKKELLRIQQSIAREKDPELMTEECKKILEESQREDIDVFVGNSDGGTGFYRMTPREALNILQSRGVPLVLRSGRQATALHKVISSLSDNIYQLDLSSLTAEEKAVQKRSLLKQSVGILQRIADDDVSRHGSSVEKLASEEEKENKEAIEKFKADGPGTIQPKVDPESEAGAGGGVTPLGVKTKTKPTRLVAGMEGSKKTVKGGNKTGDVADKSRHTTGSSHNYESIVDGNETEEDNGEEKSHFLTADQSNFENQLIKQSGTVDAQELERLGLSALSTPLADPLVVMETINTLDNISKGNVTFHANDVEMAERTQAPGVADHTVGSGGGAGGMSVMETGHMIFKAPTLQFAPQGSDRREVIRDPGMDDTDTEEVRVEDDTRNITITG